MMLPVPEGLKPVAPPVAAAVQVSDVTFAGNRSVIVAPFAAEGPLLVTTIV